VSELRKQFIDIVAMSTLFSGRFDDMPVPVYRDQLETVVSALLKAVDQQPAIGDSGRVAVDRARFERLLEVATEYAGMSDSWKLEPGDLEPLPGSATNADTLNPALADWSFSGKP